MRLSKTYLLLQPPTHIHRVRSALPYLFKQSEKYQPTNRTWGLGIGWIGYVLCIVYVLQLLQVLHVVYVISVVRTGYQSLPQMIV